MTPVRPDDDLASYVAARRPVLEEVLLRLDCPRFLVAGVLSDTRGRLDGRWERIVRAGDVDVEVLGTLLVAWQDRRRGDGWQLRVVRVLADVAGLDETRADDVRDRLQQARVRPVVVRAVAGLAAGLLAVGVVATVWPGQAGEDRRLPDAEVQRVDGLVGVVWYAGGLLRLRDATVAVGAVRALAEVPDGAVYVAGDGRVVVVDDSGTRTALGEAAPDSGVVAAADGALAAWREPGGDLVVVAVEDGREVARVGGGLDVVAINEGRVYVTDATGSGAFVPGEDAVRISGVRLVDVSSGSRLAQAGTQVRLSRPAAGSAFSAVTGSGLSLSPDGRFALVRTESGLVALDLLGGTMATGVAPGEQALAGRLGQGGTVVLVVDTPVGARELRTCVIGTGECRLATGLSVTGDVPVFAH